MADWPCEQSRRLQGQPEKGPMVKKKNLVYVIDDDRSVRRAFQLLFQSANFDVLTFCSADEFLESANLREDGCIILDMRMPGMTGPDLLKNLASRKIRPPVIIVSAHDDTPTRDLARELGAQAFFRKPVDDQALIDAVLWELEGKTKEQ
jgi:FixJ family two-component response regulator